MAQLDVGVDVVATFRLRDPLNLFLENLDLLKQVV